MAAKKINAATMTAEALCKVSKYHQATVQLRNLTAKHKDVASKLQEELDAIWQQREDAEKAGELSGDEIAAKFSTVEAEKAIRAENVAFKAACDPWKRAQMDARKMVPKDIYVSYKEAYEKGNITNYEKDIKCFLLGLGIQVPTPVQLNKIARKFVVRTSGARKANQKAAAEGHYISEKSKVQYADIFMLAILEWLIVDNSKVFEVLNDNTLALIKYED